MSNNESRLIVTEKNIDTLMEAVKQLQERDREKTARLDWIEQKMAEVDNMQRELYAVLHTINLQALGAAVQQLQEKYRALMRDLEK
jgi:hypothetical protein